MPSGGRPTPPAARRRHACRASDAGRDRSAACASLARRAQARACGPAIRRRARSEAAATLRGRAPWAAMCDSAAPGPGSGWRRDAARRRSRERARRAVRSSYRPSLSTEGARIRREPLRAASIAGQTAFHKSSIRSYASRAAAPVIHQRFRTAEAEMSESIQHRRRHLSLMVDDRLELAWQRPGRSSAEGTPARGDTEARIRLTARDRTA